MQQIIDFLKSNWETIALMAGNVTTIGGWLAERKKRMRDSRDADVAFWEKTIERQNSEISKLELRIEHMQTRYESQIEKLLTQVAELSDRLEKHEPGYRRKINAKSEKDNA